MWMFYVIGVTREEKEKELRELLASGVVREKTQLHSLLTYLGTKAIEAPQQTLKEYTIGIEALGKPADYDPRIDPSVRVEVAKLRQRLKEYYNGAGAAHPVRLEIPKGAYMPAFVTATPRAAAPNSRKRWILAAAAMVLVTVTAVFWLARNRPGNRLAPEIEAFWAPHFTGRPPTLLIYGAPLFYRTGTSFYRNTRVNRPEDLAGSEEARGILDRLQAQKPRPVYHFTGVGEVEALFHLTRLLAANGAVLMAERSNTVTWEDLKGKHVVFLGGRKFNPQIPELPYKPKFEAAERRIVNLDPGPGEPAEYPTVNIVAGDGILERHALISVYPGFTPGTRLVTLECYSTDGTLAAAEFLTRPDMLAQLVSHKLPLRPERGVFRAFQVVIGARFNRGVVVSLFYKTHRVLP
jgi:hypothetical protein